MLFRLGEFTSHITIARVGGGLDREALAKFVETNKELDLGKFEVREIKLKKSTLSPKGPKYEDL